MDRWNEDMSNLIINAERMFDGHTITNNVSVLVINGIIKKIGKPGDFKGKVVNTRFLSPGLIDMHMHIGVYAGFIYAREVELFEYFNKMLLYNGITTIRDVGSYANNLYNFKHIKGPIPNIFSSVFLDGEKPTWRMSFVITNKKQIKEIFNTYKVSGIGWIKAYKSITPSILKAIIKEAHSEGLKVAGHLLTTSPKEAINMKIDTLEHIELLINGIDGKVSDSVSEIYKKWARIDLNSKNLTMLIENLTKSNTAICPTLFVTNMNLFPSAEYSEYMKILFPFDNAYKNKKPKTRFTQIDETDRKIAFINMLKLTKKLNDAGVKLIAGSDAANPFVAPGFSLYQELRLLVDSGLTPIAALKTATSNAAEVLGTESIGQIKPGSRADMILVSEPVDSDITNINKITHVILNGNIIKVDMKYFLSKSWV